MLCTYVHHVQHQKCHAHDLRWSASRAKCLVLLSSSNCVWCITRDVMCNAFSVNICDNYQSWWHVLQHHRFRFAYLACVARTCIQRGCALMSHNLWLWMRTFTFICLGVILLCFAHVIYAFNYGAVQNPRCCTWHLRWSAREAICA